MPSDIPATIGVLIPVLVIVGVLLYSFRILREYERGVVFMLGRLWRVKGPGLIIVIPFIQQMVRVDLRTRVLDVPPQDVISRDNVSVRVNAVVYFRVMDPEKAIIQVEYFNEATSQLAQTTLRSVLGQHDLDQMLAERSKLNADIQQILDEQTDAWGIKVANVELKHVDLNESMVRAIAKQAEAERIRRAKVIDAEGELQAAERLAQAGQILAQRPEAMQLRYLTGLQNIASERSSTIVFPIPMDFLSAPSRRTREIVSVRRACPRVEAFSPPSERTPDGIDGPVRADVYDPYPGSVGAIDQRVRTDCILDVHDVDLRGRLPLQRIRCVAGPDAPCRAVVELHDVAPVMLLDSHLVSRLFSLVPSTLVREVEPGI
jgi:regulator of protease activity HflC (stomatin/prohibitin superfamily)